MQAMFSYGLPKKGFIIILTVRECDQPVLIGYVMLT